MVNELSAKIIVPVKDEEIGLQHLVEDFKRSKIDEDYKISFIFVIDARTTDGSKNIATKLSNDIIEQRNSTGKGDAISMALSNMDEDESNFFVFLDADGSYSFLDVRKILSALIDGADVASGSRFLGKKFRPRGMSRLHHFGNYALSKISSLKNRRKISDLCTGLYGFRKSALIGMNFKSKGFDLEAEIVGLARKHNLKHMEIAVDWSHRRGGESKLRSIRDGIIILSRILKT